MVTIQVANLMSRITGVYDWNIHKLLDRQLSYQVEGVEFIPSVQNGFWDGIVHLYSTRTFTFSTGLLSKVCDILTKNNIPYTINDTRVKPVLGQPIPTNTKLRKDQEDVVKICMEKARGIVALPTGWGKSFSQIDLVCRLNLPTVIVVHKLDIMQQFIDWFKERAGIEVGQIGNGIIEPKRITIAMIQTLANAFKIKSKEIKSEVIDMKGYSNIYSMCTQAQMVIADEAHNFNDGNIWRNVFNKFTGAYFRLGFTATPRKSLSGELLSQSIFGPIISSTSYTDCVNAGYLTKPEVYVFNYKQQGLPYGTNYQQAYKERIVENEDRNFLICQLALKYYQADKRVCIFVTHINHGKLLKQMLETVVGKGQVVFIEGAVKLEKRQEAIKAMEEGKLRLVIGSNCITEGVNIKSMDCLISARCGMSRVVFLQTIGRALRLFPGKDKATIIDIQDTGVKYFAYQARERLMLLNDLEFNIKIVNNVDAVVV